MNIRWRYFILFAFGPGGDGTYITDVVEAECMDDAADIVRERVDAIRAQNTTVVEWWVAMAAS